LQEVQREVDRTNDVHFVMKKMLMHTTG